MRRVATSSSPAGSLRRWSRWEQARPTQTRAWSRASARGERALIRPAVRRASGGHGSLVSDWVEVFAPVVFEPYCPRGWPASGSLLLDDLPFWVRDPDTGRTRVAFRVFAALGFEGDRPKLWRLEAFTTKSQADWEAFLGALPGSPQRVVCDNDDGLTEVVGARFPDAEASPVRVAPASCA